MGNSKWIETCVGLFIIMAVVAMLVLSFKVSDFSRLDKNNSYEIQGEFDNIGALKARASVTIAGVKIGQVEKVVLDPTTYKANVYLRISNKNRNIPVDSSMSILTAGLLGANYVSISPGFDSDFLQNGGKLNDTHPALILEDMIGQLLFSMKSEKKSEAEEAAKST